MAERRGRRGGLVLAAVAVLVTAGVVLAVTVLGSDLPDQMYELDEACGGATYDDAAPYGGSAPHPAAIFMPSEVGQLLPVTRSVPGEPGWVVGYLDDPAAVQLVACGVLESEEPTGSVCGGYGIQGITVPMSLATYRIRVYELRTHRELRSVVVEGEDTECPRTISANHTPDRFLSELTDVQWRALLVELAGAAPS